MHKHILASLAMSTVLSSGLLAQDSANYPAFRGASGTGFGSFKNVPTQWDEATGKNLLWKKDLDLAGWASPVVWGKKVIALGANGEKRAVYCVDLESGKDLWKTEVPVVEGSAKEYIPETQSEDWNTKVHAGATPAVNGKQVFAMFSIGQLAALDLESGKVIWNVALGDTSDNKFGLDNSLLVYKDSVIAVVQGAGDYVARFDAATGKQIWKTARKNATWASPILVSAGDKTLVVLLSDPALTAWDAETGAQAWSIDVLTGAPEYCVGPSPVAADGMIFVNSQNGGIHGV
jgi:outer membrane protein assembly factor BamB